MSLESLSVFSLVANTICFRDCSKDALYLNKRKKEKEKNRKIERRVKEKSHLLTGFSHNVHNPPLETDSLPQFSAHTSHKPLLHNLVEEIRLIHLDLLISPKRISTFVPP